VTQESGFLVDFGGVSVGDFEPLPEGIYDAVVFTAEVKTSAKGTKYVAWEFKVTQKGSEGRKAWLNNSLQEQALWTVMRTLAALGEPVENMKDKKFRINLKQYFGKPCRLAISQEEYQGEPRQRVLRVLPPGGDEEDTDFGGATKVTEEVEESSDDLPFE